MQDNQTLGLRLAIALAGVAVATGARWLLDPALGDGLPFAPYLVASTVVAWAAGGRASLLALALGLLTGAFFFVPPRGTLLPMPSPALSVEAIGCLGIGVTVAYFVTKLQRAQQQAQTEVTQRQRAEERLTLAQAAGGIGVWDWDASQDETFWSDTMWALYGADPISDGSEVRASWFSRLHPEDRARVETHSYAVLGSTASHFRDEFRILRQDGSVRWVECLAKIERDEQGSPGRMFGVNVDVTARKEAELALLEANRRKDEFLVTLAHELRNPLAPIANAMEFFKWADGDAELVEQARSMLDRQVGQMVRLIDDLLDLSRITRNKLTLRKEATDLETVIGHAVEACGPLVESRRHQLQISLPAERIVLDADPVRLTQVLGNLLTNACKYTDEGGRIWLEARREGDEAVVAIRDEGIGIPPDQLANVFEMFTQLDRSPERSQGGLGIGLSLARRLVEMHEGTLSGHSEGVDRGSEFRVRLPMARWTSPVPAR